MNSVNTQAGNFCSAVQEGIDPRTGLFSFNFPLATLSGTPGLGPFLPLALNYSPLLAEDRFGLGVGVSFGLTTYDESEAPGSLVLSTGEQYRVNRSTAGELSLHQCKLPGIALKKKTQNGISQCHVRHKNGHTEILSNFRTSESGFWLPTQIVSPTCRHLTLHWSVSGGYHLNKVLDENKKIVCQFEYKAWQTIITFWPETDERLVFRLDKTSQYLTRITNASLTTAPLRWTLAYDNEDAVRFPGNVTPLCGIITPAGLNHNVIYEGKASRYNRSDASARWLPVVMQSKLIQGTGQPEQTVTYRYSPENFLGYNADVPEYVDSADDLLFSAPFDYTYWSEVTLKGHKGTGDNITRRTYNRLHLLMEEKTWQGTPANLPEEVCVHTQTFTYYMKENTLFKDQPAICQLPKTHTQSWKKGNGTARTETTCFEYDEVTGNLLKQTMPDGMIITCEYYPINGETGMCPADPGGLMQRLKSRTVTPVRSAMYNDEPITRTESTYVDIAEQALNRQQAVIMPHTESVFVYATPEEETRVRNVTTYYYVGSDTTAADFGRMERKTFAFHNENAPDSPYIWEQKLNFASDSDTQRITRTVITRALENKADSQFTGPVTTTSQVSSGLSGHVLSGTDAAGNTINHHYDVLGRPTGNTLHPEEENKDYRAETSTEYIPYNAKLHTPEQIIHTDILGNRVRTSFDALGAVMSQAIEDVDGPVPAKDTWHTLLENTYDAWGRVTKASCYDRLRDLSASSTATSPLADTIKDDVTPTYNNWGGTETVTGNNGIVRHTLADPVTCTVTSWVTDTEGNDTPRTVLYHDLHTGKPVKTAVFTTQNDQLENRPYSIVTQEWDGAGRLRKTTDPQGHVTLYTYDVFGRTLSTTLPDDTVISRTYVPFSTAALPVSISVYDPDTGDTTLLGSQHFDALGRLVSTTTGKDAATGRTTTFDYEKDLAARPNKNSVTGPDRVVCTVQSDPRLGNAVLSVEATDNLHPQNALPGVKQTFSYNKLTGQIKSAIEGDSVTRLAYAPSGALLQQVTQVHGGIELITTGINSLAGRSQRVVGVDGSTWRRTYITEDAEAGLISEITDDKTLKIHPDYDALYRAQSWTVTDLKNKHTLTTGVEWDDFGREISRTLTHSNGEIRMLKQTWYINGQLKTRTLARSHKNEPQKQTEILYAETFIYDSRSRLKDYQVTGTQLPKDTHGNAFTRQQFTFDALSNIATCITTLDNVASDAVITTTYGYAEHDPCQLRSVSHDKTIYGYKNLTFSETDYDSAGRLTKDEAGRRLYYDALGRLVRAESETKGGGSYGYDAGNRLSWQSVDGSRQLHRLYYRANRLVNEWISPDGQQQDAAKDTRIRLAGTLAQTTTTGGLEQTLLLGTDGKHSVLIASDEQTRDYGYTPYGGRSQAEHGSDKQPAGVLGYNGERLDPVTSTTHLGNGYRAYNPVLMRFHCPDSLSPFGAGGINPYAYCAGDPINHTDPSGHLSWNAWLSIGLGILGVVIGVATLGLGAAGTIALGTLAASMAVLDVASGALAIASGALEEKDPELSQKLGWASLGVGAPSMAYGAVKMIQGGLALARSAPSLYRAAVGTMLSTAHASQAAGASRGAALTTGAWRAGVATQQAIMGVRAGVQGGKAVVVSKGVSMGSNERNFTALGQAYDGTFFLAFEDIYRGGRRLNIMGHGNRVNDTGFVRFVGMDGTEEFYSGAMFADMLRDTGVVEDFGHYQYARTIVCYSAHGDAAQNLSFAGSFAERSGLPTKGFVGQVGVSGVVVDTLTHFEQLNLGGNFPREMLQGTMDWFRNNMNDPKRFFRIMKPNEGIPYFPVLFPAPGRPYLSKHAYYAATLPD